MAKPLKRITRLQPAASNAQVTPTPVKLRTRPVSQAQHSPSELKTGAAAESGPSPRSAKRTAPKSPAGKSKPDAYEVGYAKPPPEHRFSKGTSGNPKGRPKGLKNYQTIWDEALSARVRVRENGREVTKSKQELLVIDAVNKAVTGDHKARQLVLNHTAKQTEASVNPGSRAHAQPSSNEPTPMDLLIIKQFKLEEFFGDENSERASVNFSKSSSDEGEDQ